MDIGNELKWITDNVTIRDLKEYEHNPRRMTKAKFQKLVASVSQDGYHQRILVDTDNTIIGGHSRKAALMAAGYKPSDAIEVLKAQRKLTEEEFKRLNIRDNLGYGDFDYEILANHFDMENLIELGMDVNLFPPLEPLVDIIEKPIEMHEKCEVCGK